MSHLRFRKPLLLAAILVLNAGLSAAQEDRNVQIMKKLFSKLTASLTAGTSGAQPGQTFLVLMNPGIFVDPSLDSSSAEGRYVLAHTLNQVPSVNWLMANDSAKKVYDVYKMVLDFGEWGYVEPTDAQKLQLAKARRLLYVNGNQDQGLSQAMNNYQKYADLYQQAIDAYEIARNDKENGKTRSIPSSFANKKATALRNWQTVGRKNEIEAALATDFNLGTTTAGWFTELRNVFNRAEESFEGDSFYRTGTYPSYSAWFSDSGWTRMTFVESEIEKQTESNRTSFGGGGGAGWGLWRVSASAQHTQADSFFKSDVKDLNIEMEVKRVSIIRPWLNHLIFESPRWRFSNQGPLDPTQPVSDGKGSATTAPSGLMPLYPTAVLIARKVRIHGGQSNDLQTSFESHTRAGGSVGWGPFEVGGHYSRDEERSYVKAVRIADGIEILEPQIIGWFCEVLAQTPKPTNDPRVKWLSDAPEPQGH